MQTLLLFHWRQNQVWNEYKLRISLHQHSEILIKIISKIMHFHFILFMNTCNFILINMSLIFTLPSIFSFRTIMVNKREIQTLKKESHRKSRGRSRRARNRKAIFGVPSKWWYHEEGDVRKAGGCREGSLTWEWSLR